VASGITHGPMRMCCYLGKRRFCAGRDIPVAIILKNLAGWVSGGCEREVPTLLRRRETERNALEGLARSGE